MKTKMNKLLKNRQIILALLVMVVVTAGIINWAGKQDQMAVETSAEPNEIIIMETPTPTPNDDYFAQVFADRENARSQSLDVLEGVTNSSTATTQQKDAAMADIRTIAKNMETEVIVEGLIKSKGFENAVVYISDDTANIIVKAKGLTAAQVAQIKDIATSKTGFEADKIKISEVSGS